MTNHSPASPLSRARWRQIALSGYAPTLAASMGFGAIMPLIPLQALALGASKGGAAFMAGLFVVGALLFELPAGVLAAKFGDRRAMIGASVCQALAVATVFFWPTLATVAAAVVLCGAAQSVFGLARQSFLIAVVPPHARGRALSTLGGTHRVGFFVGPLVGAAIVASFGLTAAFGWAAVLTLVCALIVAIVPELHADGPSAPTQHVRLLPVLRSKASVFATVGVGVGLLSLIRASRQAIIPLWCASAGLSPSTTSLITAASMACDVALFFPGGYLMDRLGRWWMCVPTLLIMSTGLALLPLARDAWAIVAVAMLLGIGNGLSSGIVMTLSADHAPDVGRPQFLAGFRLFSDVGGALGPLTIAVVASVASLSFSAFACAGAGFFAAWWLTRHVPRRRTSAHKDPDSQ